MGSIVLLGIEVCLHSFSVCGALRWSDPPGRDSYQVYQNLISEARGSYHSGLTGRRKLNHLSSKDLCIELSCRLASENEKIEIRRI